MQIVIDIDEEIYKKYMDDWTHSTDVLHAVRHGTPLKKWEWIDVNINPYTKRTYCEKCGKSAPFMAVCDDYGEHIEHIHGETVKTKYCPNCGAKMEVEE
jgi:ribosomal protein S27AE